MVAADRPANIPKPDVMIREIEQQRDPLQPAILLRPFQGTTVTEND